MIRSQSAKEWKRVIAEMEGDPTISRERREGTIEVAKQHSNWELRNLGRRIYFESNAEERARMPPPSEPVDPLPYLSPRPGLTYEGGGISNL